MGTFVIVKYHCEASGESTGSVDYQVRYFEKGSAKEIKKRICAEKPQEYMNSHGETVSWLFDETVAIEVDPRMQDGEEIIGFITGEPREVKDARDRVRREKDNR